MSVFGASKRLDAEQGNDVHRFNICGVLAVFVFGKSAFVRLISKFIKASLKRGVGRKRREMLGQLWREPVRELPQELFEAHAVKLHTHGRSPSIGQSREACSLTRFTSKKQTPFFCFDGR